MRRGRDRDTLEPRHVAGETGDRDALVELADQLDQAAPHIGFRAASPGRNTLVESPISASTPSAPTRRSAASSAVGPTSGSASNFQSPVWSTVPTGVRITSALGSGIEWVSVISSDLEWADREAARQRNHGDARLALEADLGELASQQRRRERGGVDRAAELPP